jgi:LemA protein
MWIVIAIPVVIIVIVVLLYNSLIARKNQVMNVFSTVDVTLKRRYDLLPELILAVKTYMQYERSVLEEITKMRSQAISDRISDDEKIDLDNKITKALGGIMVAVENYPDLKASQNFLQLQREMTEIEEQIAAARRAYNAAVTDYNNAVEMFPTNLFAAVMSYKPKKLFEIESQESQPVIADKIIGMNNE